MNCNYCDGIDTVEQGTTRFCAVEAPHPFVVDDVPASICRICGDKSFTAETVTKLEKIKTGEAQTFDFRVFRVFDFNHLDGPAREGSRPGQDFIERLTLSALAYGKLGHIQFGRGSRTLRYDGLEGEWFRQSFQDQITGSKNYQLATNPETPTHYPNPNLILARHY